MAPSLAVLALAAVLASPLGYVRAACEPEIPFPPPQYSSGILQDAFSEINSSINAAVASGVFNTTSFSLEISSSQATLYSLYHTAETTQGTKKVDGSSVYRIASNSKLFTALGTLKEEAAGNLSLDDLVIKYIPDLQTNGSNFSWDKITIRSLLSHQGGLPDNYAEDDLLLTLEDPTAVGLPPISAAQASTLPKCEGFSNYTLGCTAPELITDLRAANAVFPPHKETSYSNVGYDLLGLVFANITGQTYDNYLSSITGPLGLKSTSVLKPNDSVGVIVPGNGAISAWNVDMGVGNPSGGIYSSSADMIEFLRYVLKNYQNISPTLNWLMPAAYSSGSHSFFGYPWEIFRASSILPNTKRPVTFNTKGGGLVGYYSYSIVIPEYDLVVFMAAGGELTALDTIFAAVRNTLVVAAESVAQSQLNTTYAGLYSFPATTGESSLNSSITISQSANQSLYISSLISNSTDVLSVFIPLVAEQSGDGTNFYFQLIPTFETRYSATNASGSQLGEVWRFINVVDDYGEPENATTIWDDYCVANIDPLTYAGRPLNEVIFWRASNDTASPVTDVELTAFEVTLGRV